MINLTCSLFSLLMMSQISFAQDLIPLQAEQYETRSGVSLKTQTYFGEGVSSTRLVSLDPNFITAAASGDLIIMRINNNQAFQRMYYVYVSAGSSTKSGGGKRR